MIEVSNPPVNGLLPIGCVTMWMGKNSILPNGYLLCNGQAISRATFAALYAAIGLAYGEGDGTTTFNVPDMRNCAAVGSDGDNGEIGQQTTNYCNAGDRITGGNHSVNGTGTLADTGLTLAPGNNILNIVTGGDYAPSGNLNSSEVDAEGMTIQPPYYSTVFIIRAW